MSDKQKPKRDADARDVFDKALDTAWDTAPYWQAGAGALIGRGISKRFMGKLTKKGKAAGLGDIYGDGFRRFHRRGSAVIGAGAGYASGSVDKAIATAEPPKNRKKK